MTEPRLRAKPRTLRTAPPTAEPQPPKVMPPPFKHRPRTIIRGTMDRPRAMRNRAARAEEVTAFHRALKACDVDHNLFARLQSGHLSNVVGEARARSRVFRHMQCAGVSECGIAAAAGVSRNAVVEGIARLEAA